MQSMIRKALRSSQTWIRFSELRREGFLRARRRWAVQRSILQTPPLRTTRAGPVEVRMLTWRRDWVNAVWALKSFYHNADVEYPLVIHDGGLLPRQVGKLLAHFPDARFISLSEGDARFGRELRERGFVRSAEYRLKNGTVRKLFDFFLDSTADYVVTIDSDIVFFRRPDELIVPAGGLSLNRSNRDAEYWYSLSLDELEAAFGIRPPPLINSGLAVIRRETIDFPRIEQWLAHPKLFADGWVTEQTLHALCSTLSGVEFLSPEYRVGGPPGLSDAVCKHYPGHTRDQLYSEGMPALMAAGLIAATNRSPA